MAQKPRRKKSQAKKTGIIKKPRSQRYTAGEIFAAILGGALVILFLGIVITSILGE